MAPRELQKLETILRGEHSRCPNNPVCTQIAKDIAVVADLQIKVNNLIEFMNTKMNNGTPQFLNSTIGNQATFIFKFHSDNYIKVVDNPVFIKEISILNTLPCP